MPCPTRRCADRWTCSSTPWTARWRALAGLVAPQAARYDDVFRWVVPVVVFIYAQILLGTVAAGDELFRRRVGRTGKGRALMSAIGRRRILQVKVLVATIVVLASSQIPVGVGIDDYAPGNAVGWSAFEFMFSCVAVPMFVGVWWRRPGLAWYAVVVLPLVFALSLLPRTPDARWEAVLGQGWIVVAADVAVVPGSRQTLLAPSKASANMTMVHHAARLPATR